MVISHLNEGGPGSGNFGHTDVAGRRGGSAPRAYHEGKPTEVYKDKKGANLPLSTVKNVFSGLRVGDGVAFQNANIAGGKMGPEVHGVVSRPFNESTNSIEVNYDSGGYFPKSYLGSLKSIKVWRKPQ